ncbi:hypothetical protein GUITHDRAFT_143488 [Guillardia theta CCMP2712]|uniref:G-patch domain-containing protein n=1 Tax=Guillardia theta (strain CCMP2712) TaxID=905079 RepID=L1IUC5_GUITC|nr:hypothetical protein GUITHDRAFT_143488 [Guillardia theta CCMP2712]EKX39504.1 hypothetical protein GUITHDRAFT_143488 [Guillardia theta CCMP2712]|eukprot:XP_005826484.1 hypothetical protein GUITHDRAFT_143488 [Guillardia theta CCMP2712]
MRKTTLQVSQVCLLLLACSLELVSVWTELPSRPMYRLRGGGMHMHEEESGDSWSSLSSEEKKRKSKLEELDNMADGVGASLLRKMGYDGGGLGLRERSAKAQGDFLFSERFRKAFGREKEFDANTTRSSKMSQRFCESFDEKYGEVLGEESAGSLRENEQGAPSHPPKRTNWKEFDAMSREQARPRKREKPDDMEELFRFRERNRNKTEAGAYQDKEFSDVSDKDESESNQSLEVKTEVKVDMGLCSLPSAIGAFRPKRS